jgi:hypothetical protein
MMERIQQLAEQARHNQPFECSYTKDQWLQTFAQLIVAECVGVLERQIVQTQSDDMWTLMVEKTMNSAVRQSVGQVQQHFGMTK